MTIQVQDIRLDIGLVKNGRRYNVEGSQLGNILVQKGFIQQQQLDAALAVQGEQQLGQVLINWGWITQEQLLEALDIQAPPPPPRS